MKHLGLGLSIVVWVGGCGAQSNGAAKPAVAPPSYAQKTTPPGKKIALPRGVPVPPGQKDEHGLPLIIVMHPPEVPPEIRGPSPPIPEPVRGR